MGTHKLTFLAISTFFFTLLVGGAILLPTATSSIVSVASNNQLAQVSGATTGNYPASITNPANFHPGHYMFVGATEEKASFDRIKNYADFKGVKKQYFWDQLEPKEGVYNFTQIEKDLAYLQSIGKRLWIQVGEVSYSGCCVRVPVYMRNDPKYGDGGARSDGVSYYGAYPRFDSRGWYPIFWNPNVSAKLLALYQALGDRFNSEAYLEGITIDETSVEIGPGGTASNIEAFFKARALLTKNAFPDKTVIQQINFAPYDLVAFTQWLVGNGIGLGFPDTVIGSTNSTSDTGTYALVKKYHNNVPTAPDVQWDNFERINPATGVYYTSAELLAFLLEKTDPWYIFWNNRNPYFLDGVLPAVTASGLPPAAAQFYAGGGGTTGGGTTTTTCSTYLPNSTPPTGFGASYNLFTTARELLLSAICNTTNTVSLTSGNAAITTYIWNQAYYTRNGQTWNPITLTGTNTAGNGQWIIGTAQTTQPLTTTEQATQNYYASYVCTYTSNTWKCGCSDTTCATPKWNLQGMKK